MKVIKRIIMLLTILIILYFNQNKVLAATEMQEEQVIQIVGCENDSLDDDYNEIVEMFNIINIAEKGEKIEVGEPIFTYDYLNELFLHSYPIYVDGVCIYIANVDVYSNVTVTEDVTIYYGLQYLKERDYEYIIYTWDENFFAQNKNETIALKTGEKNSSHNIKINIDYKIIEYSFEKENLREVVIEEAEKLNVNNSRTVSTTITSKTGKKVVICSLRELVLQNKQKLCWAASVATIVNYKNQMSITAEMVADKIGLSYDTGGSQEDIIWALHRYGLDYKINIGKLTWYDTKNTINADDPFIIILYCSKDNTSHAITAYGYACSIVDNNISTRYIYAWDSNGYRMFFSYSSTAINTSGRQYSWYSTIYPE